MLTVTGVDPAWAGRRGRINAALIREQARGPDLYRGAYAKLPDSCR